MRYDDQNHLHWIESWMQSQTLTLSENDNVISLVKPVYISFIPFNLYSNLRWETMHKKEIQRINKESETMLIEYLRDHEGWTLLNVQNN